MRITALIEAGACLVNGAAARPGARVASGDLVELSFDDGPPTSMFPQAIPLEIVHEDAHLIVVVKPAGMLVHPTLSVKTGTLLNALAYHLNRSRIEDGGLRTEDEGESLNDHRPVIRPGLVHRLDRATSGLLVIAKTPRALTVLSRHFRKRLVEKRYLALVHGVLEQEAGIINAAIGRDPDQQPRWRVMESGKPAETRFKALERFERATLLELEPVTGRTNQLRIHCAHIAHPIVGDEIYDCGLQNAQCGMHDASSMAGGQLSAIRNPQSAIRLCLHAWNLGFHHPAGGEWMEFTSRMPGDITAIVDSFRF